MLGLLIAGAASGITAYFVAQAVTTPGRERDASLRRISRYGSQATLPPRRLRARRDQAVGSAADLLLRLLPSVDLDAVTLRLQSAGLGRRWTARGFLVARVATAAGGVLVALVLALGGAFLWGVVLGGLGWLVPSLVLRERTRRRRARIRPMLPDALDLLAVSVEAGMGLDASIQKLIDHMDGPLAEEFELTLTEIRMGESRQRALTNLTLRVGIPELTAVARAIIQADHQGNSLGRVLRVQATEARSKRQLAAEEEANKAPVKMLFPTLVFIFPALFLVILGPALLTLATDL
jgi:tight adherence protein C